MIRFWHLNRQHPLVHKLTSFTTMTQYAVTESQRNLQAVEHWRKSGTYLTAALGMEP